jgi:aspartate/methionine/tyrosine aminotransferase
VSGTHPDTPDLGDQLADYVEQGQRKGARVYFEENVALKPLLEDAGVAIIGGPDFGILGEGYVRLSYANSTENILKALGRMGEFLASRKAA